MEVKLIITGGKVSKKEVKLKLPTTVGRSRDATLSIAHPMVSRHHCKLFEMNGLLMVRDLGSLNGTIIKGARIEEAPLPPQAEFSVGPLTFRAQYQYAGDLSALPATRLATPSAVADTKADIPTKPLADSDDLPDFAEIFEMDDAKPSSKERKPDNGSPTKTGAQPAEAAKPAATAKAAAAKPKAATAKPTPAAKPAAAAPAASAKPATGAKPAAVAKAAAAKPAAATGKPTAAKPAAAAKPEASEEDDFADFGVPDFTELGDTPILGLGDAATAAKKASPAAQKSNNRPAAKPAAKTAAAKPAANVKKPAGK